MDEYFNSFNSVCRDILDEIAPLKYHTFKTHPQPWMNNETRIARQACRRAERRLKKDRLQISFEILRDARSHFQSIVKAAKANYFSNIINKNSNKPNILFKTINKVISPIPVNCIESNQKICEDIFTVFL